MKNEPSEEALKNFYKAIKPGLVRIIKEEKKKKEVNDSGGKETKSTTKVDRQES